MRSSEMSAALIIASIVTVALAQPPGPRPPGAPPGPSTGSSVCTGNCGLSLTSRLTVSVNATHRVITTNGIPSHSYYTNFPSGHVANPNNVCEKFRQMTLPLSPTLGTSFTILPLGPVGILNSGGFIYNHLDGPYNTTDDLALYRAVSLDTCNGHPDQDCRYHYHMNPASCIVNYTDCGNIGYLADGFPIYGFCTVNGTQLISCYDQKPGTDGLSSSHYVYNTTKRNLGLCHFDEANGYCFTDGVRGVPNGGCRYGYVLSDNYPFVIPATHGAVYYGMATLTSFPSDASTPSPPSSPPASPPSSPPSSPGYTPGSSASGAPQVLSAMLALVAACLTLVAVV